MPIASSNNTPNAAPEKTLGDRYRLLIRRLAMIAINLFVLYVLINEMLSTPTYSESDITFARENAVGYARAGNLDEAERRLKAIVRLAPDNQDVRVDYSVVLSWNDKNEEALSQLEYVDHDTAPDYYWDAIIESALIENRYGLAVSAFENMKQQSPSTASRLNDALIADNNGPRSESLLQRLAKLKLSPKRPPQDNDNLIDSLEETEEKKETNDLAITGQNPTQKTALSEDAKTQTHIKTADAELTTKIEEVKITASAPLALAPDTTPAKATLLDERGLELLAKQRRESGQLRAAEKLYRMGLKQYPNNDQLALGLALVLSESKRFIEASTIIQSLKATTSIDNSQLLDAEIYHYRLKGNAVGELNALEHHLFINKDPKYLNRWLDVLLSLKSQLGTPSILERIQTMRKRFPESKVLLYNAIALLESQQTCDKALSLREEALVTEKTPLYVLRALWRCAREQGQFAIAKQLTDIGIERYPNSDMAIYDSLIDSDQGHGERALETLDNIDSNAISNSKEYFTARAYAYETMDDALNAAITYHSSLERWPDDDIRERWLTQLSKAGAATLAMDEAQNVWDSLKLDTQTLLKANMTAASIRRSLRGGATPEETQHRNQQAVDDLHRYIAWLLQHYPADHAHIKNARFDRLIALHRNAQPYDAIDEYRSLSKEGFTIPKYALSAVAGAYLHLRFPKEAEAVLMSLGETHDKHYPTQVSLYYARLEQEQYDQAQITASTARNKQVIWRVSDNNKIWLPNMSRLNADRLNVLHQAYDSHLESAQERFEHLVQQAPASSNLRNDLSTIYRYRGWPRRTLNQLDLIKPIDPEHLGARINRARAIGDMRHYQEWETHINDLAKDYPSDPSILSLAEDWNIHNRAELNSELRLVQSYADDFTTDENQWINHWYTEPLNYHYRVFVYDYFREGEFADKRTRDNNNEFGQRHGEFHLFGAGLEYRDTQWQSRLALYQKLSNASDTGLLWDTDYQYDDHWSGGFSLSLLSPQTPLASDESGMTMDHFSAYLHYRWHEGRHLTFGAQIAEFSETDADRFDDPTTDPLIEPVEDNQQQSFNLRHFHRFYENAHHIWSLSESLSYLQNDKLDSTLYFSPDSYLKVGLGLHYDGILRRHYHNVFKHHLSIGLHAARQTQVNFIAADPDALADSAEANDRDDGNDTGALFDLYYEHRWEWEKQLTLYYGISASRQPYDGDAETTASFRAGLNWRH